jgi:hypothetical protein
VWDVPLLIRTNEGTEPALIEPDGLTLDVPPRDRSS